MPHWQFFAGGMALWCAVMAWLYRQPDHSVRGWRKGALLAAALAVCVLTQIGLH